MKKKSDFIVLILLSLSLTLAAVSTIVQAKATELKFGKPMADRHGSFYVLQVEYGEGHYFVACFDKPEEMQAFAKLGSVYTTAGLK